MLARRSAKPGGGENPFWDLVSLNALVGSLYDKFSGHLSHDSKAETSLLGRGLPLAKFGLHRFGNRSVGSKHTTLVSALLVNCLEELSKQFRTSNFRQIHSVMFGTRYQGNGKQNFEVPFCCVLFADLKTFAARWPESSDKLLPL